jgi:predicted DNA-binding transcriptional regulator YafY
MKTLQADKRLIGLRLREIAPGIVVSGAPADLVLDKLRDAGYSPAAESAEGTILLQRKDALRTSSRPTAGPVTVTHTSQRLVKAAVKALHAGEKANEAKSIGEAPKTTTTQALNLLNDALQEGRQVWIGYADRSGITTERIIEPLTIAGGFMTAFDLRSNEVKNFTIARITGAQYAEETEEAK